MKYAMKRETALKLGEALGMWAIDMDEASSTPHETTKLGFDCVAVEESDVWASMNAELDDASIDAIFKQMYATAFEEMVRRGRRPADFTMENEHAKQLARDAEWRRENNWKGLHNVRRERDL